MTTNELYINHPAVNIAYKKIKNDQYTFKEIVQVFEETYKCKVSLSDEYGISGAIIFEDDKHMTWFLLQNSSGE